MWDSQWIATLLEGELRGDSQAKAHGCCIDSRLVKDGNIFFALVGEKVDGHDYIKAAWQKGASVVVAEKERLKNRPEISIPEGKALIQVDLGLIAMQSLAQTWVRQLGAKVVAITGSNGKTTTKDMVTAVLSQKYRVHKNLENQNNELGVPMTILNASENTEILVLEMGMRGLGQIAFLCGIARPDIGVITNIGTTHLELLGTQENIARAKWELIQALPPEGFAVLNSEDEWSVKLAQESSVHQFFYGLGGKFHKPDLRGLKLTPFGTLGTRFTVENENRSQVPVLTSPVKVDLPLPGEHNVLDALAALSVGLLLEVPLQEGCEGLATMELSRMRLELQQGIYESTLISDVYNANPTSMKASLQVLRERGGASTLAILGEMYELGEASREGHYEVGQAVADLGISELITVGKLAEEIARGAIARGLSPERVYSFPEQAGAIKKAQEVLAQLSQGTWVLIKASRGMKMEEVTEALRRGLE
ncbi:UDP-N-acetylmuramoyl-tripeptide--D-alanyl-D-alanine ligase [Desulfitobacterium dichloroeliminans LMG P-21439]|uniref:UDP-N-acetylmuramoyl-tripeptide--D-alanyl-D-alanine ligase n=1 Tax=Desulfitobacterium dichloroeliminans (strain LMG P-21439 / DCA1) TaxID=871963 RepID=L0FAH5_DESDL|nr:UDP-N-acetylmuramoyl-tripeptide--D-alanyl-D-alanine ligase [Desulfitobacterium dichloroeliminans]AGA70222.1 UDP-N-acetylmuramoyl-tripeptide--D-alanyl-D-alanine ligase [Desulfitobacterium dichloroeliminans LMG P-21439]